MTCYFFPGWGWYLTELKWVDFFAEFLSDRIDRWSRHHSRFISASWTSIDVLDHLTFCPPHVKIKISFAWFFLPSIKNRKNKILLFDSKKNSESIFCSELLKKKFSVRLSIDQQRVDHFFKKNKIFIKKINLTLKNVKKCRKNTCFSTCQNWHILGCKIAHFWQIGGGSRTLNFDGGGVKKSGFWVKKWHF